MQVTYRFLKKLAAVLGNTPKCSKVDALLPASRPLAGSQNLIYLEPRVLYNAVPLEMVVSDPQAADSTSDATSQALHELILVDDSIADVDSLLREFQDVLGSESIVVHVSSLDSNLDHLNDLPAEYHDIDRLHVLTHGSDGQLRLGANIVEHGNSAENELINSIQTLLAPDGSVLLYGCDIASSEVGQLFVDELAEATGVAVFASSDVTGSVDGGNWILEYGAGSAKGTASFELPKALSWEGSLASTVITVTTTSDVVSAIDGLTSLREAILQANAGSGGDTILLSAGNYVLSLGSAGDNAGHSGDLDILKSVAIVGDNAQVTSVDGNSFDRVFHVQSGATLTLRDLSVQGGKTNQNGAGVFVDQSSTLFMIDSVVQNNNAQNSNGGGIFVSGTLSLERVLVANNSAGKGGGIYHADDNHASFRAVTISSNVATSQGGGIWSEGPASLVNVTVAKNSAAVAGGIFKNGGGSSFTLKNSILDNPLGSNANRTLDSLGHNLDSDGTAGLSSTGDLNNVTPLLGDLNDNGGSVKSHALLTGSLGINAGSTTGIPEFDSRGYAYDVSPDIGSFAFVGMVSHSEQLANQTTSNSQVTSAGTRGSQQAVSVDGAGNTVVVWSSDQSTTDDSSGWGVRARLFDSSGEPLGAEFLVNQSIVGDQQWARVERAIDGTFVVTWTSGASGSEDVYFRRFAADGTALTNEIRANNTTTNTQKNSVLAMDRQTGEFVVAWQGQGPSDSSSIFFRRFDALGNAKDATDRLTNSAGVGSEQDAAIAMQTNGSFVIAWERAENNNVYFQRFDNLGNKVAGETQIDNGLSTSFGIDVATDAAGNFTFVYREEVLFSGIWQRSFWADGTSRNLWTQITGGDAASSSIDMLADGRYVVAWQKTGDGNGTAIYAQKFLAPASSAGAAAQVNVSIAGNQNMPSIAALDFDNYVVVWSGQGSGDTSGVFHSQFGTADVAVSLASGPPSAADDSTVTSQNTSVGINVLANDFDPDHDTMTVMDTSKGSLGTSTINADGSITYAPNVDAIGSDSFQYVISDGSDGLMHYWNLNGHANDSVGNADGQLKNGVLVGTGAYGDGLWFDEQNDHVLMPDISYANEFSVSFKFKVDDNSGTDYQYLYSHGSADFSNGLNIFLGETGKSTFAGVIKTVFGDSNDSYALNDLNFNAGSIVGDGLWHTYALTVSKTAGAKVYLDGTLKASHAGQGGDGFNPTGNLILGGRNDFDAVRFFGGGLDSVSVFDRALNATEITSLNSSFLNTGKTSEATVAVSIINRNPTANAGGPYSINEGGSLDLNGTSSSDPDGDALTYRWDLDNDGNFGESGEPLSATARVNWTTLRSFGIDNNGSYSIGLQVNDGNGGVATTTTTLVVNNVAPTILTPATVNFAENSSSSIAFQALDPADSLTYSITGGADRSRFSINSTTGQLSFKSPPNFESPLDSNSDNIYQVIIGVNDGTTITNAIQFVNVTDVNEFAISLISDSNSTSNSVDENATTGTLVGVTAYAFDRDGSNNQVTYSLNNTLNGRFAIGALTGVVTVSDGSKIDFESRTSHVITVTATSADGSTRSASFTIAVNDLNENVPTIGNGQTFSVSENAPNGFVLGTVSASDLDPNETLSGWTITGGNQKNAFTIDANTGVLSLANSTKLDFSKQNTFLLNLTVTDGTWVSAETTITVSVLDFNYAPVANAGSAYVINEGSAVTFNGSATNDADGDSLIYEWDLDNDGIFGESGEATSISPQVNWSTLTQFGIDNEGSFTVGLRVSDGQGGVSTATANLVVNNVAPQILTSPHWTISENTNRVGTITGQDPVDSLAFSIAGGSDQSQFTINSTTGELRFLNAPNFEQPGDLDSNSIYQVQIAVTDGLLTTTQNVQVTVADATEPVIASNDSISVLEGGSFNGNATVLLANDQFFDQGTFKVKLSTNPLHGTVAVNQSGSFVYVHNGGESTSDQFVYQVIEVSGAASTATVFVNVTPVDDAPQAKSDLLALNPNSSIVISPAMLIANDVDPDSTITGIVIVSQPSSATGDWIANPDGTFTYTPSESSTTASFSYQSISNGKLSNVVTATLSIGAPVNNTNGTSSSTSGDDEVPDEGLSSETPDLPIGAPLPQTVTPPIVSDSSQSGNINADFFKTADYSADTENNVSDSSDTRDRNINLYGERLTATYDNRGNSPSPAAEIVHSLQQRVLTVDLQDQIDWTQSYFQQIDEKKEELLINFDYSAPVTATAAAGLITVGYLTWMIRGGVLLTTFVSSLPAWQSFDPLPVVQNVIRERDGDEGIEDLVENDDLDGP